MRLLALDLSTKCTGYAIFQDGILAEYGDIPQQKYQGASKDKYPKKSLKLGKLMAIEVAKLIEEIDPDSIVIEEASISGKAGVKAVKGLIQLHGMVLDRIEDRLDTVSMVPPSGKDGWRTILDFSKKKYYAKAGRDWKAASILCVKEIFGIEFKYEENDIADSILIGEAKIRSEK